MRDLSDLVVPLLLTIWYFASVYFAAAALYPRWALAAGLVAAMLAMLGFLALVLTRRDQGFPLALLAVLPTICIAAGIVWWILRWFDLFVIR